jgi:hypothetical protein
MEEHIFLSALRIVKKWKTKFCIKKNNGVSSPDTSILALSYRRVHYHTANLEPNWRVPADRVHF